LDNIVNFHLAQVSNRAIDSHNNLIERIKWIGFGFRGFESYRIRALLDAGKPNWHAGLNRRPMTSRTPPESEQPIWTLTGTLLSTWWDVCEV
jgi:hypothetical protein